MDSQLPKVKALGLHSKHPLLFAIFYFSLVFIFFSSSSFSGEVDLDMFGFTYHLHRKGAVHNAPLKLDKPGVKVFNPGLGLGYDFRQDLHTEGLSAIVHGGMFENCDNHPVSFVGAGGRYRKFFHKKYFWETNVMAVANYGNDSDNKRYKLNATPYLNIGLGRDYGKYLVTYYLSYIPKGSDGGITQSTDMLFLSVALSF